MEQCRQAGITSMALVSDKEGIYVKVGPPLALTGTSNKEREKVERHSAGAGSLFFSRLCVRLIKEGSGATQKRFFFSPNACPQVKSFEKDRQTEKRIPEGDLVDHVLQKYRTRLLEDRNGR